MTRSRLLFASLALALIGGGLSFGVDALLDARDPEPRLEAIVHGGEGPPTVVLLHGFGAAAEGWAPSIQGIRLPPRGRFVLPQGPELTATPAGEPDGGRAWWALDLYSHIPVGASLPDLSATSPPGLSVAADLVADLLRETAPERPIVLGGFSQGAMVASQIAFVSKAPLEALVLLSGTLVNETMWDRGFAHRRGLPVFLAHGRSDAILPFALAERLRKKLGEAGLAVTWVPFDGGHEIPSEVVAQLNRFLEQLWAAK